MNITVNGIAKNIEVAKTLADLIAQFCKTPKNVIAELNGNIITNDQVNQIFIKDGDNIELVTFVGGG